jgi:hypothetical protein
MCLRKIIRYYGYAQQSRPGRAHLRTDYYKPAGQDTTRRRMESGGKKWGIFTRD